MCNFRAAYASLVLTLALAQAQVCVAQENELTPDLTKVIGESDWSIVNREAKVVEEEDRVGIYFAGRPGDGVAWLKNVEVADGIIEVDIKGTDVRGRSFVGIAFRRVDEETFDGIYFRPFNFRSEDPMRNGHSVQYISHPEHTWSRLREEHPEEYENRVDPVPDPNAFFRAKIVLQGSNVSVFVNENEEPCLVVESLSVQRTGWIGLWTGNNSDGTFANLKIVPTGS